MRSLPLVVAAAAAFLTSCLPLVSQHPLPAGAPEARLLGSWRAQAREDEVIRFVVDAAGEMSVVARESNGEESITAIRCLPLERGGFLTIDMAIGTGEEKKVVRVFAGYELVGTATVALFGLAPDPFAAAVQAKELAGEVKTTQEGKREVLVTAEPEALAAWLRTRRPAELISSGDEIQKYERVAAAGEGASGSPNPSPSGGSSAPK